MSRPIWFVRLVKRTFPGRFLLARATRAPLVGRVVDHLLFHGDHLIYLPKDTVVPVNLSVPSMDNVVLPYEVVEHFIRNATRHWIMNACLCRDANGCLDYPVDLGCLFLGDAVVQINPALGHLVSSEEALAHMRRCREAGLVQLVGRNKLDSVWLGAGPGTHLMTICNCCPCCCLWRVLPHLAPYIGEKVVRLPGVEVTVTDGCVGCGTCAEGICFVDAIRLIGNRATIDDTCRVCGRCVEVCPNDAIELTMADEAAVTTAIQRLSTLVDLE